MIAPKTVRTEIIGGIASFYDKNGELLGTASINLPNQLETVDRIKKLGVKFSTRDVNKTMAAIQGQQFVDDLEELIKNAAKNGVQVLEQGENHVTMRMSQRHINPRIEEEVVLLIDKKMNRVVGNRVYDVNNELLQTTFFEYSKGEEKYLNAIKQEQKVRLPSGKEVKMVANTKISNFKFNLNI